MNMKKLTLVSAALFCASLSFSTHAQDASGGVNGALSTVANFILNGEDAPIIIDPPVADNAVVIRDLLATDTGELRFDFANAPLLTGRIEVSYTRSLDGTDAFISLLNTTGSTSSGRPIADLRIRDGNRSFQLRDQGAGEADAFTDANAGSVVLNDTLLSPAPEVLQTAVITWNYDVDILDANGTVTVANGLPSYTVSIDGTDLNSVVGQRFISGAAATDGVDRIQFRVGSNGNVSALTETFTITSFSLFNDEAGTDLAFTEDFSGFTVGDNLSASDFDNAVDTTIEVTTAQ